MLFESQLRVREEALQPDKPESLSWILEGNPTLKPQRQPRNRRHMQTFSHTS